ncbi:unnamed protein product [Gordionus sp. m RMFG-2023]
MNGLKIHSSPFNNSPLMNTSAKSLCKKRLFGQCASNSDFKSEIFVKFRKLHANQASKWNFDFVAENPLPGPYQWQSFSGLQSNNFKSNIKDHNSHDVITRFKESQSLNAYTVAEHSQQRHISFPKIPVLVASKTLENIHSTQNISKEISSNSLLDIVQNPCLNIDCKICSKVDLTPTIYQSKIIGFFFKKKLR